MERVTATEFAPELSFIDKFEMDMVGAPSSSVIVTLACPSLIEAPPVALDKLTVKVSVPSWSVSANIGTLIVC